jgi:hypothetical protein
MSESKAPAHQSIPEPQSISVDPATDERARDFLRAITLGRIGATALDERLSAIITDAWIAPGVEHVAALGNPEEMYPFEQRTTAEGVATYYRVRYPAGLWTWVFSLDHAGRINGFSLRSSRRYKIFDVWLRNVEY